MRRLEGQVAVVTGGARGIGEAIARRFAAEGASVAIADIEEGPADETARRIAAETGSPVAGFACDVSNGASVRAMHEAARARFGMVGVLVNNAGVNIFREPLESSEADWRRCMAVDLEGAWLCARAVLPEMITRRDGSIVNIISNHAMTVIRSTFPYPVAKHGLLGLTRALALQYAGDGVAVNAISPGWTDTRLAQDEFDRSANPAAARAAAEAKQPPGRLCRPDEVAAVAALLASHEARFMIGENIVIDGGVSIRMYE